MSAKLRKKPHSSEMGNLFFNLFSYNQCLHIMYYALFLRPQTTKDKKNTMYWTLELASKLEDAPWPATKEELIDYAQRSGAPDEVIENLMELEEEGEVYETIEDVWPDYPTKEDFLWAEDEY